MKICSAQAAPQATDEFSDDTPTTTHNQSSGSVSSDEVSNNTDPVLFCYKSLLLDCILIELVLIFDCESVNYVVQVTDKLHMYENLMYI